MTLNYGELLKAKRKEYVQAESAGTLRLANIGGATVKSRFTDAGESNNGIMGSRRKVQADPDQDDFLTQYFKNVYASNLTLQEQLSNSEEGSSTSAMMGPDNKPLDILNKGDDINIKIDSESNEGIENFYADLSMSESSSDSKKRRVNKDGTEYAGELQFGNDRHLKWMNL
jgi:trehalose/maltose hydrolase-like predicted phosphorylase